MYSGDMNLVFPVQAGRPVGGRFLVADAERLELQPYVDETRNLLIQDLIYPGGRARPGFANGSGSGAESAQDGYDPEQSYYFSDGLRAVTSSSLARSRYPRCNCSIEFLTSNAPNLRRPQGAQIGHPSRHPKIAGAAGAFR